MFFCNQFLHDKRYVESCWQFRIKTGEFSFQFSTCHNGFSFWIDENEFRLRFVFYSIQNRKQPHYILTCEKKFFFQFFPWPRDYEAAMFLMECRFWSKRHAQPENATQTWRYTHAYISQQITYHNISHITTHYISQHITCYPILHITVLSSLCS